LSHTRLQHRKLAVEVRVIRGGHHDARLSNDVPFPGMVTIQRIISPILAVVRIDTGHTRLNEDLHAGEAWELVYVYGAVECRRAGSGRVEDRIVFCVYDPPELVEFLGQ